MPKHEYRSIGVEILEGIRQLKRGETGGVQHFPSVTAAREQVGLSQSEFARLLGVSVRTLQEWEQGRRMNYKLKEMFNELHGELDWMWRGSIWPSQDSADHRIREPEGPPGGRGLTSRSSRRPTRYAACPRLSLVVMCHRTRV